MIQTPSQPAIPAHERAVEEFWLHVVGYKGLVLGIIVVSNLLGLFFYSLADPVYESRIGIQLRRAFIEGRLRKIQPGEDVLRYFQVEFENSEHDDGNIRIYKPIVVKDSKRELIFILVRGGDRDALKKFIGEPLKKLLSSHERIFTAGQEALEVAIEEIRTRLDRLDAQAENLTDAGPPLPRNLPRGIVGEGQHKEPMLENRAVLEKRLYRLEEVTNKSNTTRVLQSPAPSKVPVSPKLTMYLFIASIVGIALGFFCAVLLARRSEREA